MEKLLNSMMSIGLVVVLSITSVPARADEIILSADIEEHQNGNTRIEIQNKGDRAVTLHSIVINRKRNDPVCHLSAYKGLDNEIWFARSDSSAEELRAMSMEKLNSVILSFGDEVEAIVFRGCGRILEVEVWNEEGIYMFKSE